MCVLCVVRRTRNTYGDRCFAAAAGPRVWNSLPAELRLCDSLGQFKRRLKTYLFGIWDNGALWLLVRQRRIEMPLLTYLLRARVGVLDGVGKFLLCLTENVRKNVLDPFDSNRNCLIKLVVLFNLDPSKTNLRVLVSYSSCSHHADKLFIYL